MSHHSPRETFYAVHGCPFTVALLSDLHDKAFDEIAASLRRVRPEVICVTGDFVNAKKRDREHVVGGARNILPFFEMCAASAPTFVSLGNHEWPLTDEDFELIRATGVLTLDNRYVQYRNAAIGGLTSSMVTLFRREVAEAGMLYQFPYPRAAGITSLLAPDVDWLEEFGAFPGPKVLLCHHPEYFEPYLRSRGLTMVLSGHAHGGQIRLFGHGLYAPGQGLLPRLTQGVQFRRLVISRGLSNTSVIPRVFNPPEIVYIQPE